MQYRAGYSIGCTHYAGIILSIIGAISMSIILSIIDKKYSDV